MTTPATLPPMLIVKAEYCHEHFHPRHYLDERGRCYGDSLKGIEQLGYSYPRHIGGQYFRFTMRKNQPVQLDWAMAAEIRDDEPIDF